MSEEMVNIITHSKSINDDQQKIITYEGPFDVNQMYRIVEDLGFVGLKGDTKIKGLTI